MTAISARSARGHRDQFMLESQRHHPCTAEKRLRAVTLNTAWAFWKKHVSGRWIDGTEPSAARRPIPERVCLGHPMVESARQRSRLSAANSQRPARCELAFRAGRRASLRRKHDASRLARPRDPPAGSAPVHIRDEIITAPGAANPEPVRAVFRPAKPAARMLCSRARISLSRSLIVFQRFRTLFTIL